MDAAQREVCDQIDLATQRLLDDARTIPEADLRAPSLLPGWTRAHVLSHVARGADAMRNLLAGARSGQDRPAYADAQAREADIERGAARRAADLTADLADSAMALRAVSGCRIAGSEDGDRGIRVPCGLVRLGALQQRGGQQGAAGQGEHCAGVVGKGPGSG